MSHLLDENDELLAPAEREVTLSAGSILGIFLGLALLCALFFGFGYNVGHRSGAAAALQPNTSEPTSSGPSTTENADTFSGFKPPASSGAKASPAAPASTSPAEPVSASPQVPAESAPAKAVAVVRSGAGSPGAQPVSRPEAAPKSAALIAAKPVPEAPAPAAGSAPGGPAGSFFVQVAAVSHPEDAGLLLGALHAKGYAVAQRTEPGDKLIHLQIGPLASKAAAEAMRQRLQADGYNAIIK